MGEDVAPFVLPRRTGGALLGRRTNPEPIKELEMAKSEFKVTLEMVSPDPETRSAPRPVLSVFHQVTAPRGLGPRRTTYHGSNYWVQSEEELRDFQRQVASLKWPVV